MPSPVPGALPTLRFLRFLAALRRGKQNEHVGDHDGGGQVVEGGDDAVVVGDHAADQGADGGAYGLRSEQNADAGAAELLWRRVERSEERRVGKECRSR